MADAAQILSDNNMQNASAVVEAARLEGLDIAIAATLIAGESWGRHIWGHDGVQTGGTYEKGGAVTRQNYEAYRSAMKAGRIGRQGCGPAQCTSSEYQDRADELGGCWDIVANCRSGFRGLKRLMDTYGTRDGARRYNGSGSAAEAYADKFMERLAIWKDRLDGATTTSSPPSAGGGDSGSIPSMAEGDVGAHVHRLASWLNATFPAYSSITLDPNPAAQRYGPQTVRAMAEFQRRAGVTGPDAVGTPVGPRTKAALWEHGYRP